MTPTSAGDRRDARPLVAHVVYRFDVGGLENGVVNLLNRLPRERLRHVVVSLTEITGFRARVRRDDVGFVALNKTPGHGIKLYPRLHRLFRELRPDIVHTRNLAALEASVPAWLAGVPVRIHGEHGRDVGDLDGRNRRYRLVRRIYRPFVSHYVALSADLERSLHHGAGVPRKRITRIVNGVDTERFHPAKARTALRDCPFADDPRLVVVGTVGRLQAVKNQVDLARAFIRALERAPALRPRLRLVITGDGPLAAEVERILAAAGVADLAWLSGARDDVPELLRAFDVFVLPSLVEGISNTILEAMASGLPVVATNVGGNAELVDDGRTGMLVPAGDVDALAGAIVRYADAPVARAAGDAARERVLRLFSLDAMVASYASLYERLLATRSPSRAAPATRKFTSGAG
jgi:sugar transferase (PEP-CTERM/EpsH1 system associated)